MGKSAAIMAVSAMTGGLAGGFSEGAALGLGAGRSAASLIGGGVGGFAGGVGGHFAGDAFDQTFNGKEGFDSVGSYMQSGAMGGATGTLMAGVGLAGGKYLPQSAQQMGHVYAQRYPRMLKVIERVQRAGVGQGVRVRMKVSEYLDLINSGFGGPGGPNALAVAGGGDIQSLPPDTDLMVTVRPLRDLNRPMQMSGESEGGSPGAGKGSKDAGESTELPKDVVEVEQVSLADDGDSAARTSHASEEWHAQLKSMLARDEVAKLEALHEKMSPEELRARYGDDVEAALAKIRVAISRRRYAGPLRSRHSIAHVKQGGVKKNKNTVAEPSVDLRAEVEAINQGAGVRDGNRFTLGERTYELVNGDHLVPHSGPGFHTLGRGEFDALGLLNKLGDTPRTAQIVTKNIGLSEAQYARVLDVWRRGR